MKARFSRFLRIFLAVALGLAALICVVYFSVRSAFPRPYADVVEGCGLDACLVFSVMKAESGFREDAVSEAGAVGIMQIMPSTAEFVCRREGIPFDASRLKDGAYNTRLGCKYLAYLLKRFPVRETALAAYNAGEGTVSDWLNDRNYSSDGVTLDKIPYAETRGYVKKITKFTKIYEFYYG